MVEFTSTSFVTAAVVPTDQGHNVNLVYIRASAYE